MLPQLHQQTGKKWPLPFSGINSKQPAVMMASMQEEMSCLAACTTFSATYGHWKACDCSLSLLCPVLKKNDATICSNYRDISLRMSSVLCESLKPFAKRLIGSYQCGFRPGKYTIDQIFMLRQILEISRSTSLSTSTHHLIVDFKSVFDTPHSISIRHHV